MQKTREKQTGFDWPAFKTEATELLSCLDGATDVESARKRLYDGVCGIRYQLESQSSGKDAIGRVLARDCASALAGMLSARSAAVSGHDVAAVLLECSRGYVPANLRPGFWAELVHMNRGLNFRAESFWMIEKSPDAGLTGRDAAVARSNELDSLWETAQARVSRFEDGLSKEAQARRKSRRKRILNALGGTRADWKSWKWHRDNVITDPEVLSRVVDIDAAGMDAIARSRAGRLPFGITPYYAGLIDDAPGSGRDMAVRAQVLPPKHYVDSMLEAKCGPGSELDFMREADTSPIDLVTRRYPAIVILKPFRTCPQICVYCQRNWEIEEAMAPGALASEAEIAAAIEWIRARPAIREVLVTGGDPLALEDGAVLDILERIAHIDHVDMIRIGTRTPVTMPMRITTAFAAGLGSLRDPGRRNVCVVTHFEHVYEITPDSVRAVERLMRQGITVYNQHVYNFFVSRRFEAFALRMLLKRIGIDPYYTFVPKGKDEMAEYRVPLARLLQERKEEARLLPGIRRTDESVFNVPGLGKNHIRAMQHRDLLSIAPDGSRIYEFHPWEKNIAHKEPYLAVDTPVLDYLERLEAIGEDPDDYSSIWYYY